MELQTLVKEKIGEHGVFKPTKEFYNVVNIRQKRFGQLMKGLKSPTIEELEDICKYFKIELNISAKA